MSLLPKIIPKTFYDIVLSELDGNEVSMNKYQGKCLLIVNIASECKLMKENFEQLRLIKKKFANDLSILLFPSNQFMGMPKSEPADILALIEREEIDFADTFPATDVNGSDSHPLFNFMKLERPGCISWNFCKFLVSKSGHQIERINHRVPYSGIENEIKKMI